MKEEKPRARVNAATSGKSAVLIRGDGWRQVIHWGDFPTIYAARDFAMEFIKGGFPKYPNINSGHFT